MAVKKEKEKLIIYTRVSSDSQEDNTSLESQRKQGLGIAKINKLIPVVVNEGADSSRYDDFKKREKMMEVYNDIKKGNIKHFFVDTTSRLARNTFASTPFIYHCYKNGVTIYTAHGKYDVTDPQQKYFIQQQLLIDELENANRSKNFERGRLVRAKQGYWHGGPPPFGYRVNSDKRLVENKSESKWIRLIYKMYSEGSGLRDIKLKLDGNVESRRGNLMWSSVSIQRILLNSHYEGYYTFRDERIPCGAIVNSKVIKLVRERTKSKVDSYKGNNTKKNAYILKRFLRCGDCGGNYGGHYQKKTERYSYRCLDRSKTWVSLGKKFNPDEVEVCKNKRWLELFKTEEVIWNTLCDVVTNSIMDRESYRSEFYGSDETGVEAVAKKKHKLKVDIRKGKMIIKDYLQKIEDLEFDKITMATKKVSKNKMMVRLEKEIEEIKIQNKEDEDVLESIKGETDWYKWYNDFHKDKKSMRKVEGENRISYYEKYVKSIVVNLNKDNINHTIKINFKLAIVDDKLVWRDKSNKKLGYSISKGKKVKEFLLKKNS